MSAISILDLVPMTESTRKFIADHGIDPDYRPREHTEDENITYTNSMLPLLIELLVEKQAKKQ